MGMGLRDEARANAPINLSADETSFYVRKFREIDSSKKGYITVNDLRRYFKERQVRLFQCIDLMWINSILAILIDTVICLYMYTVVRITMYSDITGLGTEIKMNIDINFDIIEIQVLNIDINFDNIEID